MGDALSGDFTMPKDNQPLVFLAGGIGVTPFRSMIKYCVDRGEMRDITLIYSNRNENEIAYRDIFDSAEAIGIKTVYTLTSPDTRLDWKGERGRINEAMIRKYVSLPQNALYYISGSRAVVEGISETLHQMGIKRHRIKKDFFPGFA